MSKRAAKTKKRARRLARQEARRERREAARDKAPGGARVPNPAPQAADSEVDEREQREKTEVAGVAEAAWFILVYTFDNGTPAIHRFHLVGDDAKPLSDEDVVNLVARGLPRTPDGNIVGLLRFDSERECKAEYDRLKSGLADVGVRWRKAPPHRAQTRT